MNIFEQQERQNKIKKELLTRLENGEALRFPKQIKSVIEACVRASNKPLTGTVTYY